MAAVQNLVDNIPTPVFNSVFICFLVCLNDCVVCQGPVKSEECCQFLHFLDVLKCVLLDQVLGSLAHLSLLMRQFHVPAGEFYVWVPSIDLLLVFALSVP